VIAAPIVFGRIHALPVVTEFLQMYPEIDVRLVLSDRNASLLEDHVDVAIRIGELPDSSLVATRIGTIQRVVCASPAHLAARGTPKKPEDLRSHDCVTFEGLGSPDAWSFKVGKGEVSIPVHTRLAVNTAEAAIDAAVAGIGITRVLSYQIADAQRSGALLRVLRSFEPNATPIHLVYAGRQPLPLKLRAFLDFAAPRLKAKLSDAAGSSAL
jgi:DNA-binding transcriptional LysR family regulator